MKKFYTEYLTEYAMVNYRKPKIYHGGKSYDLSKRWYVYYSFRNPETGEFVRQTPIYAKLNQLFRTKRERLKQFKILRQAIDDALKGGYSPYTDNVYFDSFGVDSALDRALQLKKASVGLATIKDYESRVKLFKKYLSSVGLLKVSIKDLKRIHVIEYLNSIMIKSSPSNRNNTQAALSSLFSTLLENEYIDSNPLTNIKKLKVSPKRNKSYSDKQVQVIFEYLNENDPLLFLFIKFISYNFLRPIEVCRLKVKDVDFETKKLTVKAKNKAQKTKIIPDILVKESSKLDLSNPNAYLFTPKGAGEWNANDINRRDHFSKRFGRIKKKLGFGFEYTMYSFRHTFTTRLYQDFRKTLTPFEAKSKLMLITGHSTMTALEKYLRDIDAELPEDYSDLIK